MRRALGAGLGLRWLAWVAAICAFAALYAAIVLGTIPLTFIYTSDTLRVHTLLQDIHDGASLRNWDFPANPYIFPDLAIYLPISFVVSDVPWRIVVFAFVQLALFLGGWLWLQQGLVGRSEIASLMRAQTWLLLAITLGITASGRHALLNNALVNDYHFGVMVMMPWVMGLIVRMLDGSARAVWGYGLLLALVSFLTALSDTLYFVQIVGPAVGGVLIYGAVVGRGNAGRRWRRILSIVAALVVASSAGYAINASTMDPRTEIYYQSHQWRQALANLVAWTQASARLDPWAALMWITSFAALAAATVMAFVGTRAQPGEPSERAGSLFAGSFALLSVGASLTSVVVAGIFTDASTGRYILPAAFAPFLLGWPMLDRWPAYRREQDGE